MDLGLAGKGVLVTGGAGGIGAATVRAFAAEGARVAIHYRTSGAEAERLAAETGGVALQADLTDEAAADALVPAAVAALGGSTCASRTRASGRPSRCPSSTCRSTASAPSWTAT